MFLYGFWQMFLRAAHAERCEIHSAREQEQFAFEIEHKCKSAQVAQTALHHFYEYGNFLKRG